MKSVRSSKIEFTSIEKVAHHIELHACDVRQWQVRDNSIVRPSEARLILLYEKHELSTWPYEVIVA